MFQPSDEHFELNKFIATRHFGVLGLKFKVAKHTEAPIPHEMVEQISHSARIWPDIVHDTLNSCDCD